jgi:clan AA aspartic protease
MQAGSVRALAIRLGEGYSPSMGLVRAKIILRNPRERQLKPFETEALVDTGSLHLCVPEHVALQLHLEELEKREVTTAEAAKRVCSYVGPLEVRFENRACYTGAIVLGDEVLLGVVPMEDMDLVVSPSLRTVTVNPASPNIPSSVVKHAGSSRTRR